MKENFSKEDEARQLALANEELMLEIAQHREIEKQLRFQAELLDLAHDAIIVRDMDARILYWNRGAAKMYGWNSGEVVGRIIHELLQSQYPEPLESILAKVAAEGGWEGELIHARRDGQRVLVGSRWVLKRNEQGEPAAILEINRDLRERNEAEQLRRELVSSDRLISMGQLAASLAHEVNNPLQIVLGYVEDLLAEVDTTHPHYEALNIIHGEARRCTDIMRELLDFTRPTTAALEWMDLERVLRESLDLSFGFLQKGRVEIETHIEPGLPRLYVDPRQLQQVFINLFFNAAEAMPSGGTLAVWARSDPHRGHESALPREILVEVSDTGTGIDPDALHHIFRPFFTTKKKRGMGLGLSVCKNIIESHGGRISVESTPGQGTTFRISLPVGAADEQAA